MDPRMSRQTRRRLHRDNSTVDSELRRLQEKKKTRFFTEVDNNHYTFLLNKKERLKLEELGILKKIKEDKENARKNAIGDDEK